MYHVQLFTMCNCLQLFITVDKSALGLKPALAPMGNDLRSKAVGSPSRESSETLQTESVTVALVFGTATTFVCRRV